jgi:hypothetical protein
MVHHENHRLPLDWDVRDPNFARECVLWAHQTRCELQEITAFARETITDAKALIAQADRILDQGCAMGRWPFPN